MVTSKLNAPMTTSTSTTMRRAPQTRLIAQIKKRLREEEALRYEEISNYPPPIPACDVHFNTLLEERDAIRREISQVDALLQAEDVCQAIHDFVNSSKHLGAEAVVRLEHLLGQLDADTTSVRSR